MSAFLDQIIAHVERQPMRELEIPEWGVTLYWRPLTLAQRDEIRRRANGNNNRLVAWALILVARNAAGELVFEDSLKELSQLEEKLPGHQVARIAEAMFAEEGADKAGEGSPPTRS